MQIISSSTDEGGLRSLWTCWRIWRCSRRDPDAHVELVWVVGGGLQSLWGPTGWTIAGSSRRERLRPRKDFRRDSGRPEELPANSTLGALQMVLESLRESRQPPTRL